MPRACVGVQRRQARLVSQVEIDAMRIVALIVEPGPIDIEWHVTSTQRRIEADLRRSGDACRAEPGDALIRVT